MDVLDKVGIGGGILTIVVGLGAFGRYILKKWIDKVIDHEYETRLTKVREELRRETEIKISQSNFKFSHTFDNTAKAIVAIYRKLTEVARIANDFTQALTPADDPKRTKLEANLNEAGKQFDDMFLEQRIYIPKATRIKIQLLVNKLRNLAFNFKVAENYAKDEHPDYDKGLKIQEAYTKVEQIRDEANSALAALEDDLQKLLGVPSEDIDPKVAATENRMPRQMIN